MAARDLVFATGDRVTTWGRFIAGPDGDWLDLARSHDLIFKPPGWMSDRSIRLIGADPEAVPTDFGPNQVEGVISVVGTWGNESIEVESQLPEIPARTRRTDRTNPPCPPPAGGWPHNTTVSDLDVDISDLESSGAIVIQVIFRPSADQEVLVVAATDVDGVTRRLSPYLPNQLCVVPSRFTRAQLDDVRDVLLAHWREWRLEAIGTGHADAQAQPFATADPFRVTPEMAEWADTLPEGLLRIHPAITPA